MEKEDPKNTLYKKVDALKYALDICRNTAIKKMNENQNTVNETKIETDINTQPNKGQNSINFIYEEPKKEETSKNFEKYIDIISKIDEYKIKLSSIEEQNKANKMEDKPEKDSHKTIKNNIKGDNLDNMSKYINFI